VHLLVNSTGLKLSGPGEWLVEKHGTKTRRAWKKLHIGVDAGTGQILASTLTGNEVDDGSQADPLLDQVAGPLASFTGDGAYDRDDVSTAVTERHPEASIIVPSRSMRCRVGLPKPSLRWHSSGYAARTFASSVHAARHAFGTHQQARPNRVAENVRVCEARSRRGGDRQVQARGIPAEGVRAHRPASGD